MTCEHNHELHVWLNKLNEKDKQIATLKKALEKIAAEKSYCNQLSAPDTYGAMDMIEIAEQALLESNESSK